MQSPPLSAIGHAVAQRYMLERVLGQGGFGCVFLARDGVLARHVAVKVIQKRGRSEPDDLARFQRETQICALLVSPNTARVFDAGVDPVLGPFAVFEYLEGCDLHAWRRQNGVATAAQAALWGTEACAALAEAHERGIVHRDIKPSNLFLAKLGQATQLKVLDFGIARFATPDAELVTASGGIIGTPEYMSPEHLLGRSDIDARADMWSLGVTLYELVSGQRIVDATGAPEYVSKVLTAPLVPLRARVPNIDPAFEQWVAACLVKDRDQRRVHARDLRLGLERLSTSARAVAYVPNANQNVPLPEGPFVPSQVDPAARTETDAPAFQAATTRTSPVHAPQNFHLGHLPAAPTLPTPPHASAPGRPGRWLAPTIVLGVVAVSGMAAAAFGVWFSLRADARGAASASAAVASAAPDAALAAQTVLPVTTPDAGAVRLISSATAKLAPPSSQRPGPSGTPSPTSPASAAPTSPASAAPSAPTATTCGAVEKLCSGRCERMYSNDNCGNCGVRCGLGQNCIYDGRQDFSCGQCSGQTTFCGPPVSKCIFTQNDPRHCGRCFNQCPHDNDCRGGTCVPIRR